MELCEINFKYEDDGTVNRVCISVPEGMFGQIFHIYENKRLVCRVIKVNDSDWRWDVSDVTKLQTGDVEALIEIIQRHWQY